MFGMKSKGGCGLQILDSEIRLVHIAQTSRGLKLRIRHSEPLAAGAVRDGRIMNEDHVHDALKALVAQHDLAGSQVHLSIPTSSTVMRRSQFPVLKDKELRNMIDVELSSGNQMPFKDPVFDFVRLGSEVAATSETAAGAGVKPKKGGAKQEEVLIFASPSSIVESYLRAVENAGLKPISVELAPLASYRLLLEYSEKINQPLSDRFIVIHAEDGHLEFSIFAGGVPVFFHSVSELAAKDPYAGAATELSRILYYFTYSISSAQESIQEIYMLGNTDWVEAMPSRIKEIYAGDVHTIPFDSWFKEPDHTIQSYAVPIGLALKGA